MATTLVIPAYNEARRMEDALPKLLACLKGDEEIIVVDDGSDDGTLEVARRHLGGVVNAHYVHFDGNRGKGAAVREGVIRARGSAIAFLDADMASDPSGLATLLGALDECEVAIGSRAHPRSTVNCRDMERVLFGRVFNRFVRATTGLAARDTQCGFKAFRAPAAKLLFHTSSIDRYAFDVEVLMLASKFGMRVKEVPVDWTDVRGSHVRPLIDSVPMAADVVRSVAGWRHGRPVEAVTIVSATNGNRHGPPEVIRALRDCLRYGDAVVSWPRGALALLPCLDANAVSAIRARLAERLPACRVDHSSITVEMLMHPSAAPLLAALRAFPQERAEEAPVICDQGTASMLLSSIGVG